MRLLAGVIAAVAGAAAPAAAEAAPPCVGSPCPTAAETWTGYRYADNAEASPSGNVFVNSDRVYELSPSGTPLLDWSPEYGSEYLATDGSSERVAVVGGYYGDNVVQWYDGTSGEALGSFPIADGSPLAVTVDPRPPSDQNPNAGAVYVSYLEGYVREYRRTGELVREWPMYLPWAIDVDASGDLWVTSVLDAYSTILAVNHYSPDAAAPPGPPLLSGAFYPNFGKFVLPRGVAVDSKYVYVADSVNSQVYTFTRAGTRVATIGADGSGNGYLGGPQDVSLDGRGGLLVADTGNNRVVHYVYGAASTTVRGTRVSVSPRGVARIRLACGTRRTKRCRGVLELSADGRRLARARFRLEPGDGAVHVRLPRAALRRLADGPLRVVASVTTSGLDVPTTRTRAKLTLAATTAARAAAPAQSAAPAAADRLLVGFDRDVSKARQERILEAAGARLSQRFGAVRGGRLAVVRPRSGTATDTLRRRLERDPGVAYAEPDFFQFASATPNDPYYGFEYALVDGASDHDIDAPGAWSTRTSCAKVAILDTGIDTDHPDLAANVHKSGDKPGNGKDDDKNGFVDDTYGYDAIEGKGSGEDDNGHGTHVAGIVAARGNDAVGTAGACWSAKLGAVKFMNSKGKGSTSDAIEGIEYAVKAGYKIVNCSFGSSARSSALHDAVDYAQEKNVLLVVAAGNDGENIDSSPVYPASYGDSNILAVAASTADDTLASFSNYGAEAVDVAAPGDDIVSTYLGGGYKTLSGTSMAAPYAAGVAALARKQEPDATYGDLRAAVRGYVDRPPALKDKVVYDGRLNAAKALAAIPSLVEDD